MTMKETERLTPVPRWEQNMAALRTLKQIEAEGRPATAAEREILEGYSGFGGSEFGPAFETGAEDSPWKRRGDELRELTTEDEYNAITGARLNQFLTTPDVIRHMWAGLEKLGATDAEELRVLEPSAGTGRFFEYQPDDLAAKSERTAVELDDLSARITALKFPNDKVYQSKFEQAPLPNDYYDIAISNVPFGDYGVVDSEYDNYLTERIQNYFFVKALDKVRPGGVVAFITNTGTLNAPAHEGVREYLSERADLLGAVRLPTGAFPETKVVTDIIYLRKREDDEPAKDVSWVKSAKHGTKWEGRDYSGEIDVNQYFIDNPKNVLGEPAIGRGLRGDSEYKVLPKNLDKLPADLKRTLDKELADDAPTLAKRPKPRVKPQVEAPPKPRLSAAAQKRVDSLKGIHAQVRAQLDLESESEDVEAIEAGRKRLRADYDAYTKKHGALISKANREAIRNLEDELGKPAAALLALETKEGKPTNLLEGRQLKPVVDVIETPQEAMVASQGQLGTLDFNHMATLLPGMSGEQVRNALIESGSVYYSPRGEAWVTASEYLSGPVVQKLEDAQIAAGDNPFYLRNVAALDTVQPEPVRQDKVRVRLGSHWLPADVVNDFVDMAFRQRGRGGTEWVTYSPSQAMWGLNPQELNDYSGQYDALINTEFGDTVGFDAADVLKHVLQNKTFQLSSKKDESDFVRAKKGEAVELAREKAELLQEQFQNWVWEDPARRERLLALYNRKFNANVPREFDERGRLSFSGMSDEWRKKMREHQRDAVFRTVHDGSVLLAHEVGFGKTAVMIGAVMERKRLGLTNKPMIVVPKPIISQFVEGFRDMYPGANVLTPSGDDFKTENRQRFLGRVATHDWDAVVLTREQFREIPLNPETEARLYKEEIRNTRKALEYAKENAAGEDKKGNAQNALENRLKHWEKKYGEVQERIKAGRKGEVTWEQMGIDKLVVDEAHYYKNLPYVTQMNRVKGLPDVGSQRAWDMYMKAKVLQDRGGERRPGEFARNGVTFATGTPVSNTIAETWTMMRYLQPNELERRDYDKFDAWAGDFASTSDTLEPTVSGQYKTTTRFAKIQNIPGLKKLFQNVADIRVARETPELAAARPWLRADDGGEGRTIVQAPLHPDLEEFMAEIVLREQAIKARAVEPWQDNMLKLSNDADEAAIDVRMQWPDADYNPEGKIQMAADNVARIYKETDAERGTQLIFLDRGTPPTTDVRKEKAKEGHVINQYAVLREELARRGIPRDKVAFIHESTTDEKRDALFENLNDGKVRVLVASTEKGGTGVNVQKRAAALHHIDAAWRPSDAEQREGRIVRQGNKVYGPQLDMDTGEVIDPGPGVRIFTYVQEGSFDEFKWGTIEKKAKPLHTIMQRYIDPNVVEMEDVDDTPPTAAMARALASRDPVALQAAEAEEEAKRLRRIKRATEAQVERAKERISLLSFLVERSEGAIPRMEADARMVAAQEKPDSKDFTLEVRGEEQEGRGAASRKLGEVLLAAPYHRRDDRLRAQFDVAEYRGFTLEPVTNGQSYFYTIVSPSGQDYQTEFLERKEIAAADWLRRIDNLIDSIPTRLEDRKQQIEDRARELETLRLTADRGFDRQAELDAAEREFALAEAELERRTDEGREQLAAMKAARATTPAKPVERQPDAEPVTPVRTVAQIEERPLAPGESIPGAVSVAVTPEPPTADELPDTTPGEAVSPDPIDGPEPEDVTPPADTGMEERQEMLTGAMRVVDEARVRERGEMMDAATRVAAEDAERIAQADAYRAHHDDVFRRKYGELPEDRLTAEQRDLLESGRARYRAHGQYTPDEREAYRAYYAAKREIEDRTPQAEARERGEMLQAAQRVTSEEEERRLDRALMLQAAESVVEEEKAARTAEADETPQIILDADQKTLEARQIAARIKAEGKNSENLAELREAYQEVHDLEVKVNERREAEQQELMRPINRRSEEKLAAARERGASDKEILALIDEASTERKEANAIISKRWQRKPIPSLEDVEGATPGPDFGIRAAERAEALERAKMLAEAQREEVVQPTSSDLETVTETALDETDVPGTKRLRRADAEKKPAKKAKRKAEPAEKKAPKADKPTKGNAEAQAVFEGRSARSKSADLRREHSRIIGPDSPAYPRWVKDGGIADVMGVDTPRMDEGGRILTFDAPPLTDAALAKAAKESSKQGDDAVFKRRKARKSKPKKSKNGKRGK